MKVEEIFASRNKLQGLVCRSGRFSSAAQSHLLCFHDSYPGKKISQRLTGVSIEGFKSRNSRFDEDLDLVYLLVVVLSSYRNCEILVAFFEELFQVDLFPSPVFTSTLRVC